LVVHLGVALGNLGLALGPIDPANHARLVYRIADEADGLGFHSVWAGDHLLLPRAPSTEYPYGDGGHLSAEASLLDPFAVLAALASCTDNVRLGFGMTVLPYRHPLIVAKLVATIDALSNGRVILGVGCGWMPEEFAAVGAHFDARGRDTDASLRFLRDVFATGEHDGATVWPQPVQKPAPPVWVGGQSPAAMRRTVEFGDVWDAPYVDPEGVRTGIEQLRVYCEAAGRDPESIGISVRGIPADNIDEDLLDQYATLGVTHVGVTLPVTDRDRAVRSIGKLAVRCLDHLEKVR
jgi:probable F420-dependent oxidoreductase